MLFMVVVDLRAHTITDSTNIVHVGINCGYYGLWWLPWTARRVVVCHSS
jgi:hypothetical protein